LGVLFAVSGGAIRGLAAFFCSLWDFTLYIGVATAALGSATGVIVVKSLINALFSLSFLVNYIFYQGCRIIATTILQPLTLFFGNVKEIADHNFFLPFSSTRLIISLLFTLAFIIGRIAYDYSPSFKAFVTR